MKLIGVKDFYFLFVIALIKIVSCVSSAGFKNFIVCLIAYSAYHLSRKKRHCSEQNLAKFFNGQLTSHQIENIVKGSFYEFWCDFFAILPSKAERVAIRHAALKGKRHLEHALENGKGAILWISNHFGRMVISKQIMNENGFSVHKVHAENHLGGLQYDGGQTWIQKQIIRPFFERCEKRFLAGIIYLPNSDSLAFTRVFRERLKENGIVCAAGDAQFGRKLIPLNFLGVTTYFPTGLVSLAKLSGAALLPTFCIQIAERSTVIIEPPIHIKTDENRDSFLQQAVAQYAGLLQSQITEHPEQYRNWHRVTESDRRSLSP